MQARAGDDAGQCLPSLVGGVWRRPMGRLLSLVLPAPVETPAEDALDDPVIGRRGWSDADAEIDLPLRRDIEIDRRKDLLLLVVQAGDVRDAAVVSVVLESSADFLVKL